MNTSLPHVTIVILNWNREADTLECLDSLVRMKYSSFSIVVVDNGSTDGSPEAIERWGRENRPLTQIRNAVNRGFVRGSNQGMRHALSTDTDYLFLLNNDTVVEPDALSLLIATAERSGDIGMVGPKVYQHGKGPVLDSAGTRTITWLAQGFLVGHGEEDRGQYDAAATAGMPYVTGTALLVKRAVLEKVGLMDEDYFCYFDDFDWGLRAREAGYRLLLVPEAVIQHKGSQTAGFGSPFYVHQRIRGQIIFARKHIPVLPFLFAFLPYLVLYRYLRPATLMIVRRRWLHLHALHSGIGEGFASPIN